MKTKRLPSVLKDAIIGNSPEMGRIRKTIEAMSHHSQHVLIVGEPGTEKTRIARLLIDLNEQSDTVIHSDASRLNSAFNQEVWLQLQRQPEKLPGSHKLSGAFLVEDVEQLTSDSQRKLAIFAKRGFFPRSNNDEPVETDFRLITTCTSNWLSDEKKAGFDSELFLALSELIIKVPSLRERRQDIPLVFESILKNVCEELGRPIPAINFEVFNQMLKYDWPGNVKELTNVVRTVVVASPESELIPQALPFYNQKHQFTRIELQSLGLAVAQLEKELIEHALIKFAGNQSRAAQALNISEANLRFKMKRSGVYKKDYIPKK